MKRTNLQLSILLALGICITPSAFADDMELTSETDRTSYALGYQIGDDFQRQRIDVNEEALVRGIEDALTGAPALMSTEAMHATLIELKRKVVNQERSSPPQLVRSSVKGAPAAAMREAIPRPAQPHAKRSAARMSEGASRFLEKNALQDGVVTMPSGLQYRVLKDGEGRKPGETDTVR